MDVTRKVEKVCVISRRIQEDAERAITLNSMLMYINNDENFRRLFDRSYEAHGLNIIHNALLHELMIVLVRMYDGLGKNADASDKASFRNIRHLLDDKAVVCELVSRARKWLPDGYHADRNARVAVRSIERTRVRILRIVSHQPSRTWLKTMRDYRDEFLAHSLIERGERERPKFGYIGDLLKVTLPVVQCLRLGVDGEDWRPDATVDHYKKISDVFWSVVAVGQKASRS